MKVVVTGSEGSLMQVVIPQLLAQGHEIIGIDNLYRYGKRPVNHVNYTFVQQDLVDQDRVIEITQGADVIIHAAAKIYGVLGLAHYRADILSDDLAVTRNVLNACVKNNIKHIVYLSSSMVYDACIQDPQVQLAEDMTDQYPPPRTDYGLSKLVCERMCEAYRAQYGINYTIWRPFNIVNPNEQSMSQVGFSHVIPDFIDKLLVKNLNPLPMIGNGEQIRCFTWIDDMATVVSNYSFDKRAKNQIFNVCNVEPITMKEVAKLIYKLAGRDPSTLEFKNEVDYINDVKVRIPSLDKLQQTFGPIKFMPNTESIQRCLLTFSF